MSLSTRGRNTGTNRRRGTHGRDEGAARAKRAQDHLSRKRRKERQRLERDRWRTDSASDRARVRGVITPIVFTLALVAGVGAASSFAEIFLLRHAPLERVAVQGAAVLSPLAIAASAGVASGRALDRIDPRAVRESVAADPWVESARAVRLPTGTLVVSIVEKRAMARWQSDASRDEELIDHRGERFAGATAPGGPLPLVRGEIEDDTSLPSLAIEILGALQRHGSLAANPTALTLYLPDRRSDASNDESGYVLELGPEGPRALLGQRLLSQRIARLAALLESEQTDVADARWIDLRYADRAVLRTEPVSG